MPFQGTIKASILSTVQPEPLRGYEIVQRVKASGSAKRLTEGQVYPYIHELVDAGMLSAEWRAEGATSRRIYQLTQIGKAEVDRVVAAWEKAVFALGNLLRSGLASEAYRG
jgi:PadR family transcriptional regulator, regulatory protein PadR